MVTIGTKIKGGSQPGIVLLRGGGWMKQTYELAGLVVLGLALADWTAPVWAQSSTKKPPAGEALPVAPTLDPLPLPAPPNPNAPAAETKPAAPGQPPEPATVRQDPAVSLEWI